MPTVNWRLHHLRGAFTYTNAFNPHNEPVRQVFFFISFLDEEAEALGIWGGRPKVTQLVTESQSWNSNSGLQGWCHSCWVQWSLRPPYVPSKPRSCQKICPSLLEFSLLLSLESVSLTTYILCPGWILGRILIVSLYVPFLRPKVVMSSSLAAWKESNQLWANLEVYP